MVYMIISPKYQPMVSKVLLETDQVCAGSLTGNQQFFRKFVKENIALFEQVDILVLDLTALADTDEETMQGIESIRIMDYRTRFIILAPCHKEGNRLLKECFYAGIYDIITTDEYLEMSRQLTQCILTGMHYKDALRFRDTTPDEEPSKGCPTVQKVTVGIAGAGRRMGSTHNSIAMANYLRQQGQMTAVAEMNQTGAFMTCCEAHKAKLFDGGYFSLNGVDFYPCCDRERLTAISGKPYNFILLDFGDYAGSDKILFNRCDVRVIFSGTKPWELGGLENIFQDQEEDVLKKYHFCFLGTTSNRLQKEIIGHMKPLENIWFPEHSEDPFLNNSFPEGKEILSGYLPVREDGTRTKKAKWQIIRNKNKGRWKICR